jgi:hypothetical protein
MTTRRSLILLNALALIWFLAAHAAWIAPAARLWLVLSLGIAALIGIGLLTMFPAAALWDRAWKRIDWRRRHAWHTVEYERAKHRETRGHLARADTEIALLVRERAEEARTLAEVTRDLNAAHAEIRNLRAQFGRRKEDRPS